MGNVAHEPSSFNGAPASAGAASGSASAESRSVGAITFAKPRLWLKAQGIQLELTSGKDGLNMQRREFVKDSLLGLTALAGSSLGAGLLRAEPLNLPIGLQGYSIDIFHRIFYSSL